MTFRLRFGFCLAPALALLAAAPGPTAAQGYKGYPYSIMTPEPGSAKRHRGVTATPPADTRAAHEPAASTMPRYRHGALVARGSSGSVLPTQLPRTQLIPPERQSAPIVRSLPQEQPPTVVPGFARPIPNLPHGAETFQDRASRCAFQQSINGGPQAPATWVHACIENRHQICRAGLTRQSILKRRRRSAQAGIDLVERRRAGA
jgi:hypothetical protein